MDMKRKISDHEYQLPQMNSRNQLSEIGSDIEESVLIRHLALFTSDGRSSNGKLDSCTHLEPLMHVKEYDFHIPRSHSGLLFRKSLPRMKINILSLRLLS